jgi:uncharacterized membrane protein
MLIAALLWCHLLAACGWIGGMFFALFILRPTLAPLEPAQRLALHRDALGRFFPWVWGFVAATLVSGFGLIGLVYGGFAQMPLVFHLMAAGGLLMGLIYTILWLVPFATFRKAVAQSDGPRAAQALNRIRSLVLTNFVLGLLMLALGAVGRFGPALG